MKNVLWTRKIMLSTVLAFSLSVFIVLGGTALPVPVITQTNSTTTVYLDPPTINGTVIDEEFNVSIMIRDAVQVRGWQAGLRFDATLLECTDFVEGEFLKSVDPSTFCMPGTINNVVGIVDPPYFCSLFGLQNRNGSGRLAYATFKVKALGVSDVHLYATDLWNFKGDLMKAHNIVDVYTVVDATSHTVVTVSNSTGWAGNIKGGFYNHAFNESAEEISFNVTTARLVSFSDVTIPKALLSPKPSYVWGVTIDGNRLDTGARTVTENATHTSIYFTYALGTHGIQITTRLALSAISLALSSPSVILGSNVTLSGGIDPVRSGANATIEYRPTGGTWTTLANVTTDVNGNYSYAWTPETIETYEFMASWEGDENTLGDESDPPYPTLTVQPIPTAIYVFEVDGVYVVIESNSSVSDFAFNQTLNEIFFNVTGLYDDIYFSNITVPKTLMWADNLDEWAVTIDGNRLDTGARTVTENATHTSIYFTYALGTHGIQITTRLALSAISLALSSPSVILGSNVTLSGGIDPVRSGANATIEYRPTGGTWTTLANVTTDVNGNYSYAWTPETIETYEFMASWEGDENTLGDESDPPYPTLTVQPIPTSKKVEEVLWKGQVFYVIIESNSTTSNFSFSQPNKQIDFNVTDPYGDIYFSNVTIPKELLAGTFSVFIDDQFKIPTKTENETHTFVSFTYSSGTHNVRITGTYVILESSTISVTLTSTSITVGSSVAISGGIDPVRSGANATIEYRPTGGTWTTLANVTTDVNGNYSYAWTPETAGTYEIMAAWEGDMETAPAESDVLILTATKGSSTISVTLTSTSITVGSSVTMSGGIDPVRPGVTVTIQYKPSGGTWTTVGTATSGVNGNYSYAWTPETAGTYEVKASWEGDLNTEGDESDVKTLTVEEKGGIDPIIIGAAVAAVIIIAATVVYFVKFRKPE